MKIDLKKIISTLDLRSIAINFVKDKNFIDDVIQETYLYLMQMNQKTLQDIYEKDGKEGLIRYSAIIIKRSFTSKNSPFFYKYKKYYTRIDMSYSTTCDDFINDDSDERSQYGRSISNLPYIEDDNSKEELHLKLEKALKNFYWYDREIIKLYYYKKHTLDSLAKETGISRNSLHTTITKVRDKLKKLLNE